MCAHDAYAMKMTGHTARSQSFSDYRDRRAIVIHEEGKPYVPTFYPFDVQKEDIERDWFKRNKDIELVLKGNSTMTIKEIAKFHIEKTVSVNQG